MRTKLLIAILLLGWLCSGIASAQAPDTLFISSTQVAHIRFGSELKYVNLGNKAIVAKIVDGSKDYVAVKAREPFDICTSMSSQSDLIFWKTRNGSPPMSLILVPNSVGIERILRSLLNAICSSNSSPLLSRS